MLSVVEGVLVSEGDGDDGDSGDSVDWDSRFNEDSAKEDLLDRASVDEGGGFSGVGVDGEGWIIADVTVVDTVDVSVEKMNPSQYKLLQ